MKKNSLIGLLLFFSLPVMAQGKYAGTKKSLIGSTYADDRKIAGITGYTYREGSLLTGINDGEVMTAAVYKKGTTCIVIFGVKEDTADQKFTIADVLEVKNVPSSRHIMTGTCQEGLNEAVDIVALVLMETNKEFSKAIKAWRFNRDKRRLEAVNTKLVKCMNAVD